MKQIGEIFDFMTGSLPALEQTDGGCIPLVYGTTRDNGVVKFVSVQNDNQIFHPPLITVSYLGTAFVQVVPFTTSVVDKSNIIILSPKSKMSLEEMYYFAALINKHAHFGFHYGRRMNMKKLRKLQFPPYKPILNQIDFRAVLPKAACQPSPPGSSKMVTKHADFLLSDLFELKAGDFHYAGELDRGNTPLVSCGEEDNGIIGFIDVPADLTYRDTLTIAFNGQPLTTKYHPYSFAAKDDVAVCVNIKNHSPAVILYIKLMIEMEMWRYSYGRKCFREKLGKMIVKLPADNKDSINTMAIESLIESSKYWRYVKEGLKKGVEVPRLMFA